MMDGIERTIRNGKSAGYFPFIFRPVVGIDFKCASGHGVIGRIRLSTQEDDPQREFPSILRALPGRKDLLEDGRLDAKLLIQCRICRNQGKTNQLQWSEATTTARLREIWQQVGGAWGAQKIVSLYV